MRKFASLLFAVGIVLGAVACVALGETGAECYTRACGSKVGIRACYSCCNTSCTDAAGCQNKCDGTSVITELKADEKAFIRHLESEQYYGREITADQVFVLEGATVASTEKVARWSLAVASDRLIEAKMSNEVRGRLECLIKDCITDERPTVRATAISVAAEADLVYDDVIFLLVDRLINDDDELVRSRALDVLSGLKARNSK